MARMQRPRLPDIAACGEFASCQFEGDATSGHSQETAELLHPRFLAEELCSYSLVRYLKTRRTNSLMHAAWSALEVGLNVAGQPEVPEEFIGFAEKAFGQIAECDRAVQAVGAKLCLLYMPAYYARASGGALGGNKIAKIYQGIATILETFDDTYDPRGTDRYAGVKPELVTLALFARLGAYDWLAYPASPREESGMHIKFNHDSYVIRNDVKVPVQVKRKSGGGYDDSVVLVTLKNIIESVNTARTQRTTQAWGNKRKATRPLSPLMASDFAQLIVRESRGDLLTDHEGWLLETASLSAVREVMEKEAIIRSQRQRIVRAQGATALAA